MADLTKPQKKTTTKPRRMSPTLARFSSRALEVSPEDVQTYTPDEQDTAIAEAMLMGEVSIRAIAHYADISESVVRRILSDPLRCAWVSHTVHSQIQHRLGIVDAAMLQRAVNGDTRAADLLYRRYGQMVNRQMHLHASMDFSKLSDKDLDAMVKGIARDDGSGDEDSSPEGPRGADATEESGSAQVLPAPPEADGGVRGEEGAPRPDLLGGQQDG